MTRAVLEGHRGCVAVMLDVGLVFVGSETDRAPPLARQRCVQLPGNFALALAEQVIDRGGNAGDAAGSFARRRRSLEAAAKFLGDKSGGELAGAPARMLHDRREERNVMADALDGEGIERLGLRRERLEAGPG